MTGQILVRTLVAVATAVALAPMSLLADELGGDALYGLACAACHNPGDQVDHRVGPRWASSVSAKRAQSRAMSTRQRSRHRQYAGIRLS